MRPAMPARLRNDVKSLLRGLIPLSLRMRFGALIGGIPWIPAHRRNWWSQELVRDLELKDKNAYHKFLWENHLAYAESYEIDLRFGYENMAASRKLLFGDLDQTLKRMNINRRTDVNSVFEVGCSLGYLLRYMEESYFPSAEKLDGMDIDSYAIAEGIQYLRGRKSKIRLMQGDMESLQALLKGSRYDLMFCLGVLMYLDECASTALVRTMLAHTNSLLILSGLAHPTADNKELKQSATRERDDTFIHNFDAMVQNASGEVIFRKWEGDTLLDGNSIYFVFSRPLSPKIS